MLSEARLRAGLPVGPWGVELYYFDSIGSTNEQAGRLARQGAAEGTLVVADEQRQGRGRAGRRWLTPAGAGLAFSLIVRPRPESAVSAGGVGLVGALGVAEALGRVGLRPQIKWPNDVLLGGRKVCGVLAEASWIGDVLDYVILGIGVNARAGSVPPDAALGFPATDVESETGRRMDRTRLLLDILHGLARWYPRSGQPDLLAAWEGLLAYRGERVEVLDGPLPMDGVLLGLTVNGWLRLADRAGEVVEMEPGDYRLRPLETGGPGMAQSARSGKEQQDV